MTSELKFPLIDSSISVKTQGEPVVSEAEMIQAVRTLLLGLGENPIGKDYWIRLSEL